MNFLLPAFLVGLAAIVVPVVLHLRHRDKDQPQKFPSLMFLEQLPIRTADRRRVTDWPLLLLRALALALLVLAFARPVFSGNAAATQAQRARAVVVLLDRSMSMAHRETWPAALDSARAIIGSLGVNDRVAIVLFDDEAEVAQAFTSDKAAALGALAKARPTSRGTRYAAALRAARQLDARAGDARAEVVVITDLQRSGVSGVAGLDLPEGLALRTIAVGPASRANSSISSVAVHRQVQPQRTMLAVQARVMSRELAAPRRAMAVLTINGRASGTREVTLPVTGDAGVSFDPVALPSGLVQGAVTIDTDALAADDTFHFAFSADDAIRVLLVTPDDGIGDEALFFERAIGVGRAPEMRVVRTSASRLDARSLADAGLVLLWDTPPTGRVAALLGDYVRRGGGLAIVAGQRLGAKSPASPLQPASISGVADRIADRGGSLGDVRLDHPLYAAFRAAPSALSSARFLRYPRFEPSVGSEVLARYDDGLPAVVERREGLGRIVLIGTPLDMRAGDFPLQAAYLPFLQRLVLHTSGRDATTLARTTGQSWLLPGTLGEPGVSTPSGDIERPARDTAGATVALRDAGVYALYDGRVQGVPVGLLAVNAPPTESDLTPVDARELLLGVRQGAVSADASSEIPTSVEIEGRQRLWRFLLVAAAVLLLLETFIANRGWRGTASRLTADQSERSTS